MEKENARAEEMGYPTPICASKRETDTNFDNAVRYIMDNLKLFPYLLEHTMKQVPI